MDGWIPTRPNATPVGRQVLRNSGALPRIGLTGPPALVAARTYGLTATYMAVMTRRLAGVLLGLSISYPAPRGQSKFVSRSRAGLKMIRAGQNHY